MSGISSIYGGYDLSSLLGSYSSQYSGKGSTTVTSLATSFYNSNYGVNNSSTGSETKNYLTNLKDISGALKKAADKLTSGFPPLLQQMTAAVSNSDAISIKSVNSYAVNPSAKTSVDVKQVASAQKNEGSKLIADDKSMSTGNNAFTIKSGGQTFNFNVKVDEKDTNKDVQQKVADAINSKKTGLTASVVYNAETKESSLLIQAEKTGEKNAFKIEDANGGSLISKLSADRTVSAAKDAIYSVNGGIDRRSESNDVSIGNGIMATLKKEASGVKVEAKRETTNAMNGVLDFVSNYNALMETAKDYSASGSNKLEKQLSNAFKAYSGSLARAGITANSDGYLKVDSEKLKTSIADGTATNALGARQGSSSGFVGRVSQTAQNANRSPMQYTGLQASSGSSSTDSNSSFYSKYTGIGLLFDSMF